MTQDDIIRMAREAGATFPGVGIWHRFDSPETLKRFANLVATRAAALEREACAKVCEAGVNSDKYPSLTDCAAAIRARGNT
jgi:hypothetical protein